MVGLNTFWRISHLLIVLDTSLFAGHVTPAMMKHMVTSVGEKLTAKEFEEFLSEVELNSDGSISTNSKANSLLGGHCFFSHTRAPAN